MDNNQQNPSRDWPSAPAGSNQPPKPRPPIFPQQPKAPTPPSFNTPPKPPTPPIYPSSPKPPITPPIQPRPAATSYPAPSSMPKPVVPPGMPAPKPPMPIPPAPTLGRSPMGEATPPKPSMAAPIMPQPAPKIPVAPLPPMPPLNLPSEVIAPKPSVSSSRVSISELSPRKPIAKALSTIFIGLLVVGGIGSLTYFVILPTFFGAKTGAPTPTISVKHASFFVNPAAASAEIKVPTLSALDVTTSLQNEAFKQLADQQIKEIAVSDKNGQVEFNKFLIALAPATSVLRLDAALESDFTGFMYYDSNGVWPGYVGKLKGNVDANAVKQSLMQLSSATNLDGLYLASPGAFQPFKDGQYKNYTTRYSVGSKTGASLNYAIIGDYLVISTSFSGFKAALPLLGL